jgi:hypothetical protein
MGRLSRRGIPASPARREEGDAGSSREIGNSLLSDTRQMSRQVGDNVTRVRVCSVDEARPAPA